MMRNSPAAWAIRMASPWIVPKAQMTVARATPSAVARPARRSCPTAVRETTKKAGPGLAAPSRLTSATLPNKNQIDVFAMATVLELRKRIGIMPPEGCSWQCGARLVCGFEVLSCSNGAHFQSPILY